MRHVVQALLLSFCFTLSAMAATPVFVIHGGAGVIAKEITPEKEKAFRAELQRALEAGYAVLKGGGNSLDAVSKAIVIMEDSPLFNAGKGAVFNHDGKNELDASIMEGATLRAGAVASVHRVKNPILLARAVMEKSPHVMLVGDGAEQFAESIGVTLVDPKYFYTDMRWQQLQEALKEEKEKAGDAAKARPSGGSRDGPDEAAARAISGHTNLLLRISSACALVAPGGTGPRNPTAGARLVPYTVR